MNETAPGRRNIGVITSGGWQPSERLLQRLREAYKHALQDFVPETSAIWSDSAFIAHRQPVHDALIGNGGDLSDLLSNPRKTDLYYGVDCLCQRIPQGEEHAKAIEADGPVWFDRLGKALGILRLPNPEAYRPGQAPGPILNAEIVVSKLPSAIDFPAPFPGEVALMTSRGPVSYRAVQAVYQAIRLKQIARMLGGRRCVEIGAGMGRTAYYAYRLGLRDYTIVDLPTAIVGQACFLAATLGEDSISLPGENARAPIKLRPPQWIDRSAEKFDIALNVDSLTEMSKAYAKTYLKFIKRRCRSFLSINHEANPFTVRELFGDRFLARHPYPMRDGYVEEFALRPLHRPQDRLRRWMKALTAN